MLERLQKVLAAAGVASRRESESIIKDGRVKVNGKVVTELGAKADPSKDTILVDDRPIRAETFTYLLLYKPRGFAATRSDPHIKKTIMELIPDRLQHLYPVGRLDVTSEGLILMTNDGDLANILTHPRYEIPKTYRITVTGLLEEPVLQHLADGVKLEDGVTKPAFVTLIDRDIAKKKTKLDMTIWEGKNRQIRRMFEALGYEVARLVRMIHGPLTLDGLRPGKIRDLTEEELAALEKLKTVYNADESVPATNNEKQNSSGQRQTRREPPSTTRPSGGGPRRDTGSRVRPEARDSKRRDRPSK